MVSAVMSSQRWHATHQGQVSPAAVRLRHLKAAQRLEQYEGEGAVELLDNSILYAVDFVNRKRGTGARGTEELCSARRCESWAT
jgi:hypothetical protein